MPPKTTNTDTESVVEEDKESVVEERREEEIEDSEISNKLALLLVQKGLISRKDALAAS